MLPADAGMILHLAGDLDELAGAPRGCGDDPYIFRHAAISIACSPRMRG